MTEINSNRIQRNILRLLFMVNVLITFAAIVLNGEFIGYINQNSLLKSVTAGSYCFGTLYLWGAMFYHWGTNQFESASKKAVWFWSMVFGLYMGAYVYYIFVYEFRKTLIKK